MGKVRILVSGASGTVGQALVPALEAGGYEVVRLVRQGASGDGRVVWDPSRPFSPEAVSGFEAVVHLAGESIIGRWTEEKKRRILDSRTFGTRHLAEALAAAEQPPRALVSASAIGYYGNRGDEVLREDSPAGTKEFTAEICREWEAATRPAEKAGIRTTLLRLGVVLSAQGGALPKMLTPYRLGLGGRMGDGRQWWSWIHVDDLVGAIQHVLSKQLSGPVNAVSPQPVTNADFTRALAAAVSRPAIFPMPAFVVRTIFGQMGDELWLASQRVEPAKLVVSGYPFKFPNLENALRDLLKA
jgi:uncharacterized protein (TIGR01777 family)